MVEGRLTVGTWRDLRSRLLSPPRSAVRFERRGFDRSDPEAVARLEASATHFLLGFEQAMAAPGVPELGERLDVLERQFRGFAFEGAGMALSLLDAIDPVPRARMARFLAGPGDPHQYMVIVGNGWALARLPRVLWRRALPTDWLLRWLALDGFGFHEAFFSTERYVHRRREWRPPSQWPGPASSAARVFDEGVGRAMWFVHGANVPRLVEAVRAFVPDRWPDLYAGIGLAAAYAGGSEPAALRLLAASAGESLPALRQGATFAAKARLRAGLVTEQNETALEVLCGMPVARAADITEQAALGLADDESEPAFLRWRQRIEESVSGRHEHVRGE